MPRAKAVVPGLSRRKKILRKSRGHVGGQPVVRRRRPVPWRTACRAPLLLLLHRGRAFRSADSRAPAWGTRHDRHRRSATYHAEARSQRD